MATEPPEPPDDPPDVPRLGGASPKAVAAAIVDPRADDDPIAKAERITALRPTVHLETLRQERLAGLIADLDVERSRRDRAESERTASVEERVRLQDENARLREAVRNRQARTAAYALLVAVGGGLAAAGVAPLWAAVGWALALGVPVVQFAESVAGLRRPEAPRPDREKSRPDRPGTPPPEPSPSR